jgi:hypothetical protein
MDSTGAPAPKFLPVEIVAHGSSGEPEPNVNGDATNPSASLRISAPGGFQVEVHPACTTESILRTLVALDRVRRDCREPETC